MISIIVIVPLATLVLLTLAGVVVLERSYPPQGTVIKVADGALNVVELGRREQPGAPVVMNVIG